MKRLTTKADDGSNIVCTENGYIGFGDICQPYTRIIQRVIDRLAAYEDTGLEPEEMEKLCSEALSIKKELDKYTWAEQEGRLVVLPCKVGDMVYRIVGPKGNNRVEPREVLAVTLEHSGLFVIHTEGAKNIMGKTVFLTRSEAETALKKRT